MPVLLKRKESDGSRADFPVCKFGFWREALLKREGPAASCVEVLVALLARLSVWEAALDCPCSLPSLSLLREVRSLERPLKGRSRLDPIRLRGEGSRLLFFLAALDDSSSAAPRPEKDLSLGMPWS